LISAAFILPTPDMVVEGTSRQVVRRTVKRSQQQKGPADARVSEATLLIEDYVAVPLGFVAVFCLCQFKPVLQVGLPQMPANVGLDGIGLVKDAYRRITHLSHLDFRLAARFTGQNALFLHQAIKEAVSNIKAMPAKYTSFPNGPRVYGVTSGHGLRLVRELVLDPD
jgi:hypothetical protein